MPRVTLSGFLIARTLEEGDRIAELLPEHVRATLAEPGCLRFEAFRSHADPCRFAVAGAFCDRHAYEAHQARASATLWGRATKGVPREIEILEED